MRRTRGVAASLSSSTCGSSALRTNTGFSAPRLRNRTCSRTSAARQNHLLHNSLRIMASHTRTDGCLCHDEAFAKTRPTPHSLLLSLPLDTHPAHYPPSSHLPHCLPLSPLTALPRHPPHCPPSSPPSLPSLVTPSLPFLVTPSLPSLITPSLPSPRHPLTTLPTSPPHCPPTSPRSRSPSSLTSSPRDTRRLAMMMILFSSPIDTTSAMQFGEQLWFT